MEQQPTPQRPGSQLPWGASQQLFAQQLLSPPVTAPACPRSEEERAEVEDKVVASLREALGMTGGDILKSLYFVARKYAGARDDAASDVGGPGPGAGAAAAAAGAASNNDDYDATVAADDDVAAANGAAELPAQLFAAPVRKSAVAGKRLELSLRRERRHVALCSNLALPLNR